MCGDGMVSLDATTGATLTERMTPDVCNQNSAVEVDDVDPDLTASGERTDDGTQCTGGAA